jgi:tetratricopeptide (TPR) repeat protein/beta-lactamase regulating signal transducer with metallopeptidase domain
VTALESFLGQPWVYRLGWTLLHFFWQGAALAVLLAGALALLRRRRANSRYLAACGVLGLMSLAPLVTFILLQPVAAPRSVPAVTTAMEVSGDRPAAPVASALPPAVPSGTETSSLGFPSFPLRPGLEAWLPWLVAAWLVGVLLLSLRLLGAWACVQRLKWRSTQAAAEPWPSTCARLAERMRLPQSVRLLQSALVQVPTVLGWLRPVVLLPLSAVADLPPAQLEALLVHELAHVRRHDYLVNLLQSVVETLLFYHPAVWWVSERIRLERENCCDDWAVALCGNRLVYARALTAMEELRSRPLPLATAANGGPLLGRIRRLLGVEAPGDPSARWSAGFVALAALAGLAVSGAFGPTPSTAAPPRPSPAGASTAEAADDKPAPAQPPPTGGQELEQALQKQLKLLAEKGDDPAVRRDTAVAYRNVADHYRQTGRFAEAEAAQARAVELLEKLVQAFPAERTYRRELARTYRSRGLLYQEKGRVPEAERTFRQCLALTERLAADFPQEPGHREDLAGVYGSLGRLCLDAGRLQEGEQFYRRALALLDQLMAGVPPGQLAGIRQQLSRTYGGVADLLQASGRPAEAEASYRQALPVAEQLVRENPKVEPYRRDLAQVYNSLGLLKRATGRMQEAEQFLRRALAILNQLMTEFQATPELRLQLARCYNQLGVLMAATGRSVEAEAAFRQAEAVLQKDVGPNPVYASELGGTLANLAQVLRGRGELPAARQQLEQAAGWQRLALDTNPENPTYRRLLGDHYASLADVLLQLGNVGPDASQVARELLKFSKRPQDFYRAISLLARRGAADPASVDTELALKLLSRAEAAGLFKTPANREWLEKDKNLEPLRKDPEFLGLMKKVKGE